jgi:branched-chain amino acid transport system ATP-binding protein
MSALTVTNLSKAYGGVQAVRDVSFTVAPGELVAIIGPNGAGKTTCFNMVNGQLAPDRGGIRLGDASLVGLPPHRIWRLGVGRTFQVTATFGSMSVRENVQAALLSHHGHNYSFWPRAAGLWVEEANALLERVGMAKHAARPCAELAYGDLKRVELALALANRPRLLLMDEPTAGMAPRERAQLMQLTAGIARERGIGVLFTEHDMDAVFGHADDVIVLVRGEIIAAGRPSEVRANARVREVYLGGSFGDPSGLRAAAPSAG